MLTVREQADRDAAAEAWLVAQHSPDWYIGEASETEWSRAYEAVDGAG